MASKKSGSSLKVKASKTEGFEFARFLRSTRCSLGLTQKEFGQRMGLSRANICDIEKGRHLVGVQTAAKVARTMGLPEKIAIQACLQDQLNKAGLEAKVAVS